MNNLTEQIIRISPTCKSHMAEIDSRIKVKTFAKGEYIVDYNAVCKYIYFIDEGLAKISLISDGKERVMRFFSEKQLISVLDSFIQQAPSKYIIEVLEETKVSGILYTDLIDLTKQYHCCESFYRKLLEMSSINMMNRIADFLENSATQRYQLFVQENKSILNRISLGDISNYIGISQVSLSRIRAKVRF